MKTQVFLLAAILFIGLNSFKNEKKAKKAPMHTSITGMVMDHKTGESLAGVAIALEGTNLTTYTDFDGKFSFENVKPGDYKISTTYVSYKKNESKKIRLNKNEMHKVDLKLSAANE
ncbi:carboxypeptidase-like regulatory domain-containing protein [Marinilabiliaceae bacterium JC017]|nr:carboxypeptidase-like regulatory domain-containing protein [Marinilabiliaceae bacterium JC017]